MSVKAYGLELFIVATNEKCRFARTDERKPVLYPLHLTLWFIHKKMIYWIMFLLLLINFLFFNILCGFCRS